MVILAEVDPVDFTVAVSVVEGVVILAEVDPDDFTVAVSVVEGVVGYGEVLMVGSSH